MGVSGKYTQKFKDANIASAVEVSMDNPPEHCFFDVMETTDDTVTLKSHGDGTLFTLDIDTSQRYESVCINQQTKFDKLLGIPSRDIRIIPMVGNRF